MQAVNQMNVQGSQTRQGMQEMERDRQRRDSGTPQGQRQAPVLLEGPPEGSRGHRGCGGMEGREKGVAGHNLGRIPGTGAKQGEWKSEGRARARRCGAEGRANEAEDKRVSRAARCLYQAEGQAGGQAGRAGGQARAAEEVLRVRQAEREGGQEDRQGERED